jgi:cytoskeleton protein RodZ
MAQGARAEEPHEAFEGFEPLRQETVGVLLARARQEIDQSVADVAASLRIRRVYLEAIEEGRYAELPGATYAVGFVRSYADYLGLDSDFLVERFKGEIAGLDRRQQLHFPAPKPEGRIPGGALILVSLLLIGIAYGGWYYANQNDLVDGLLGRGDGVPSTALPEAPTDTQQATQEPVTRQAEVRASPDGAPAANSQASLGEPEGTGSAAGPAPEPAAEPTPEQAAEADAEAAPDASRPETAPASDSQAPSAPDVAVFTQSSDSRAGQEGTLPDTDTPRTPEPPIGQTPPPGEAPADRAAALEALQTSEPTPERSATVAPAEPAAPASAETAEDAPGEAGAESEATVAEPETSDIATAATETLEPDIPAAPEVPSETATSDGRVYGAVNEDSRITLTATADSWVQVRSADDNLLITRVLREGDIYRVPNQDGLMLETGNAGGLQITVDGRTAPSLGRPGDVVRGISLEPQALLRGRAVQ